METNERPGRLIIEDPDRDLLVREEQRRNELRKLDRLPSFPMYGRRWPASRPASGPR